MASDNLPRRPSGSEISLGSRKEESKGGDSQEDSEDDPSPSTRRRSKRVARRVIIASDEESDEDSTNKHAKGDVTSDEDSDVKDSDGASRGNIERRTRSGRLRETVTTASKKKPKTTRSIETIKMKGDKRVSLEQPHAHDTLILADQCDTFVKREVDTCQVGIDGSIFVQVLDVVFGIKVQQETTSVSRDLQLKDL